MHEYDRVVIRYNNGITEVKDYENSIQVGYERQPRVKHTISQVNTSYGRKKGKVKDFDYSNVLKNSFRAKQKVRALCNHYSDILTKFVTVTYAFEVNEESLSSANNDFKKFIMRLKAKYGSFEYIVVPELTELGNIHFHILWSLPYIPVEDIKKIWKCGIAYITRIDSINNLGAYLSSYIDKDFGKAFAGKKHFSKSRGLTYPKPEKILQSQSKEDFSVDNMVYTSKNFNVYCGNIHTKIYNKNVEWT